MRSAFSAFIVITLLALSCNSLEVECDYGYPYNWRVLGKVLTCTISNINVSDRTQNITKVTGNLPIDETTNNTNSLTMSDVKLVNIVKSSCAFIPSGFEKFFNNLEGLRVGGSKLTQITHENLKVFPKLRYVDVWHNNIDKLDSNLFTSNPNIEYLYFGDNDISYIGLNTFSSLKNLSFIDLERNDCINLLAGSPDEINELIKKVHLTCVPNDEITDGGFCDDKMKQLVDDNKKLTKNVQDLRNQNMKAAGEIFTMRFQNSQLNGQRNQLTAKVEDLQKQLNDFKNNGATSDAEVETKIQKIEEENENLKSNAEKLKLENLNLKEGKNNEEKSSKWIWVVLGVTLVSLAASAVGYLYYNRMFLFGSSLGERLT